MSVEALSVQLSGPTPPVVLDVRSRAHYENDEGKIPGSIRVLPDQIEEWASHAAKDRTVVAYCTCPDEASSGRVSRHLKEMGFEAFALQGGYNAWKALYPVEPKGPALMPAA